jgi:hypothetical protein
MELTIHIATDVTIIYTEFKRNNTIRITEK